MYQILDDENIFPRVYNVVEIIIKARGFRGAVSGYLEEDFSSLVYKRGSFKNYQRYFKERNNTFSQNILAGKSKIITFSD